MLEFVHITKTGGTSIEEWGEANGIFWGFKKRDYFERQPLKFRIHGMPWHFPRQCFINDPYRNNETFTCVRNPYTRIISEYYCPFTGSNTRNTDTQREFNIWIRRLIVSGHDHGLPQHLYLPVDYIIKFENLQNDFTKLIKNFYPELDTTLHKSNVSERKKYDIDNLDEDTIKLINKYYENDFKVFNYKMINK